MLDEPTVDGTRGDVQAELATDAAGRGELRCFCLSNDSCILLSSRLPLAAAAWRVVRILLRQPVAHSVLVARDARSNGSDFVALLPQNTDGNSLLLAEMAVRMRVVIEERRRRRGRGRRSGCCSCSGRMPSLRSLLSAAIETDVRVVRWPVLVQLSSRGIVSLHAMEQAGASYSTAQSTQRVRECPVCFVFRWGRWGTHLLTLSAWS